MKILSQLVDSADGLSLFTGKERHYGNYLFSTCQEAVRTGKAGRPKTTLKQGVQVRVRNKDVHANHVEAFNATLRRKVSAYRRKTNTYAKDTKPLQLRLDTY